MTNKLFVYFLTLFIFVCNLNSKSILTEEEINWIKNNPVVIAGIEKDWAPFDMVDKDNQYSGINRDYFDLIESKSGLKFEYKPDTWSNLLEKLQRKEVDILPSMSMSEERKKYALFTNPYFNYENYAFVHKEHKDVNTLEELSKLKISIVKGYEIINILKSKYPNIQIVEVNDMKEGIDKVLIKKVDAYIDGYIATNYYIDTNMLSDVKVGLAINLNLNKMHFGITKEKPILASIIKKSINSITNEEKSEILNKWANKGIEKNDFQLTKEEQEWLDNHGDLLYAGDPRWLPYEAFNEKKEYIGIVSDHLKLIEDAIGKKFKKLETTSWENTLNMVKNKEVDVVSEVISNKNKDYLNFTEAYIDAPIVIVMKKNRHLEFISDLYQLNNQKVAFMHSYAYSLDIYNYYKEMDFIDVKSIDEGLKKVATGEIDAFLCSLNAASYNIGALGLSNIEIIGKLPVSMKLGFGVNKEHPILLNIMNKALQNISKEQHLKIMSNWSNVNIHETVDYSLIWKIIGGISIVVLFLIFNNRKLNSLVDDKTRELTKLLDDFDENVIACEIDINGNITYVSKALCRVSQYNKEELLGKYFKIFFPKYTTDDDINLILKKINENDSVKFERICEVTKSGTFYHVNSFVSKKFDKKGKLTGWVAIRENITPQIEIEELSQNLELLVHQRTKELEDEKRFVTTLINSQEQIVVTTNGTELKSVNNSFLKLFNVSNLEEYTSKFGDCICDSFDKKDIDGFIQKEIDNKKWIDYIYAKKDSIHKAKIIINNKIYIFSITVDKFLFKNNELYIAVFSDISQLENIIKDNKETNLFLTQLLDSIPNPVFYKDEFGRFIGFNKAYERAFNISKKDCIGKTPLELDFLPYEERSFYHNEALNIINNKSFLKKEQNIVFADNKMHNTLFSINSYTKPDNSPAGLIGTFTDITEQKSLENKLSEINKLLQDSIKYASLIQNALIPNEKIFYNYFTDFFAFWQPKDIVGGDIYLFEELRYGDEALLMIIDCTGHGVSGAFVTMLVKAIERQIIAKINNDLEIDVSPAWILSYFNKIIKTLLKQTSDDAMSNAGFDGAVVYYNKKDKILKYSGAQLPLIYICENELKLIKADRHSVGYKKSDINYKFNEHTIEITNDIYLYITTDGYTDQTGGDKGFPFGKNKFQELIYNNYNKSFSEQKNILIENLKDYQKDEHRNDDITVIGLKISQ